MTTLVKITLAVALILSIAVPFGVFAMGEKNKSRYKPALGANTSYSLEVFWLVRL